MSQILSEGKAARKRSNNYDQLEKVTVLESAIQNKDIIGSKFTNDVTNKKKSKVWEATTVQVNALGVAVRSQKQIKNKWTIMFAKAKKEKAKLIEHQGKTGGGPPPPPMSPTSKRIIEVFGDTPAFCGLVGVESPFDEVEESFNMVAAECASPTSARFIEAAVEATSQVSACGDAPLDLLPVCGESYEERSSQTSSSAISPIVNGPGSAASIRTTTMVTGGSTTLPRTSATVSARTTTTTNETSVTVQRSNLTVSARKKKITHDDVTLAQFEVLQLQKEKLAQQIKHYKLLNMKLERDLEIE